MIEILIGYIQSKGYTVDVMPGYLLIAKYIDGQRLSIRWGISKETLAQAPQELMYHMADQQLLEFVYAENAARREGAASEGS